MNEDWLKDIHDKMSDFETEAPDGLWQGIAQAREARREQAARRKKVRTIWLWSGSTVAAAAVAVIAFVLATHSLQENGQSVTNQLAKLPQTTTPVQKPELDSNANTVPTKAPLALAEPNNHRSIQVASKAAQPLLSANVTTPTDTTTSVPAEGSALLAEADTPNNPTNKPSKAEETSPEPNGNHEIHKGNEFPHHTWANERTSMKEERSVSLAMFATGGSGARFNSNYRGEYMTGIGPDDVEWEDDPMLGILLYNQGQDVTRKIHHHLPFKAGVSVYYKFNDRISLGSGLTYSFLKADIREGSENHFFTGEQKLHYIGIPLNLKVRAFSWRGVETYAVAGVLAEKCIDGEQTTDYVLNNDTKMTERKSLCEKPLQWSANLAAGVQYNFTSWVAVYAEPGVSYYFDNGSSVETAYKETPFNFNLNFGVRFSFGDK